MLSNSSRDLLFLDDDFTFHARQRSSSIDDLSLFLEDPPEPPSPKSLCHLIPPRIGQYDLSDTIGEGSFSIVKRATRNGVSFACKILERASLLNQGSDRAFESEIRVLQQLHHRGVVKLIDLLRDRSFYFVFLEYCPNGDLFSRILERKRLTEREARPLFKQIAEAVAYIHRMGVCHRDLKPENVLLDNFGRTKLSDFGMARFYAQDGLVATPCGSPCYSSPECIAGGNYNGRSNDCWSLGVTLFAMLTGDLPWTKRNKIELYEQIRTGDYRIPIELSVPCRELIRRLMCVNVEGRMTAEDVLKSEWVMRAEVNVLENGEEIVGTDVSLRRVDRFFTRTRSRLDFNFEREESQGQEKFEGVLRNIRFRTIQKPG